MKRKLCSDCGREIVRKCWVKTSFCRNCRDKRRRRKYRVEWMKFFKGLYSNNPPCELCGRKLSISESKFNIHFDHRHGKNCVDHPAHFWKERPCTHKNQRKWLEFDFGVLCIYCNSKLPTENRGEWLKKAIEYSGVGL